MTAPVVPIERLHRQHEATVLTALERIGGWVGLFRVRRSCRHTMAPAEVDLALTRLVSTETVATRETYTGPQYRIDKPIPMIDQEPIDGLRGAA